MFKTDKRKLAKSAISSHITPAQRRANKQEDGKSVRLLTEDERRYVARINRYYGHEQAGALVHPESLRS
jgi:hypothetical protein